MARKWGARHMAWVRGFKKKNASRSRRRGRKRNPWPVSGVVAANPRRRRSYGRRRKKNPSRGNGASLFRIGGVGLPSAQTIAFAGVGFLAPPFLENFVAPYLPAMITQNRVGKYAFKVGSVLATTYIAKKALGNNAARAVAIGGGVYILASAVMDFAPQLLTAGAPRPPVTNGATMQSYLRPRQVASYVRGLSAPAAISGGNMNTVAKRFQRFA